MIGAKADGDRLMSEEDDWDFAGVDDAKLMILAAVRYLLENASASDRGEVVAEITEIVRQATQSATSGQPNPFEDEAPGG
jgi:hypothetical protein